MNLLYNKDLIVFYRLLNFQILHHSQKKPEPAYRYYLN
jgi:hypothetical protein